LVSSLRERDAFIASDPRIERIGDVHIGHTGRCAGARITVVAGAMHRR
jgi:hypothetical protein